MSSRLDVCMFTDTQGFGGAEIALVTLIRGLDRDRWRVVLAYHPGNGVSQLLDIARGLDVDLWPVPPMPEGLAGAARVPQLAGELRRRRPAVFHAHLTWPMACKFGLAAAVVARVPAVVATHQLSVDFVLSKPSRLQQRAIGAKVGRYIAVSRHVEELLRSRFGWSAEKIVVIHNAIDTERFDVECDPELRRLLSRDESRSVVLAVTRLTRQKGLPILLDALRSLPDAQVVVAGDGPDRDDLAARAQELGVADRVDFLGHRNDVAQLLACSDVVVLPSLYEGLPLSVLEAMAAERPVVATAVGGTDEAVIDGETGLLVPPGDPAALAGALAIVLGDPDIAGRFARAGKHRVETLFSARYMVEEVTTVYDDLLGMSSPGQA
jgi:glycosyltransferase involved in cell wall biosynthesis